jgi:hypothetical protein
MIDAFGPFRITGCLNFLSILDRINAAKMQKPMDGRYKNLDRHERNHEEKYGKRNYSKSLVKIRKA